jgi:hypothetical protein
LFAVSLVLLLVLSGCMPSRRPKPKVSVEDEKATPSASASKPVDPNAVIPITYDDLRLPMESNAVFQDWMLTQRVRDLDGRNVRITGFLCAGSVFTRTNIKNFVLLREKECPYGEGGEAHHAIDVELQGGAVTNYTTAPITVEGRLTVKPFTGPNGKTWAVYHLQATSVSEGG